MKKLCLALALAGAFVSLAARGNAATLTENFTHNPAQDGWRIFGNANLFQWDSTNHDLEVTWNSTNQNSYFYHPLGTILTRDDNFSLAFDLRLNDVAAGGYGFEIALGFLNLADATGTNFLRGTGVNSPNLVELDYFPDVGYGPTLWPQFVDTNGGFNYNGSSDYALYAPTLGDWYHVVMTYTASNRTLVTTMTNFEQTSGVTIIDPLDLTNSTYPFTDFRVDAISISSYNDAESGGSVFATGAVGNIVAVVPPPPVQNLTGNLTNGVWQMRFLSQSNWVYTLQRTTNLTSWVDISDANGNGTNLSLPDDHPLANNAFYRVRADRP